MDGCEVSGIMDSVISLHTGCIEGLPHRLAWGCLTAIIACTAYLALCLWQKVEDNNFDTPKMS